MRSIFAIGAGILALFAVVMSGSIYESVNANEIVVIQSVGTGKLTCYNTPGWKWQGGGSVTSYLKRDLYNIANGRIRFNDAGSGTITGSIQFELPACGEQMLSLHSKYGSQEAIRDQVMGRTVDKVIYMTGPLMSSRESYAEKRTNLITYVQDQLDGGVFKVVQRNVEDTDPISGQKRNTVVAEVAQANGQPVRAERSVIGEFGVKAFNFAISDLKYDDTVEKQIQEQQQLAQKVQTAIAAAREAEQRKLTTEQQGAAEAAKAKWDQEVIKAKAVTEAEQKLRVAELNNQEAEQYRQAQLKRAEGDAGYRQKVMQADGALQQKLDAYIRVNAQYAQAMKDYKGSWTPSVVSGGANGGSSNAFESLMQMLSVKTARELGLDPTPGTRGN